MYSDPSNQAASAPLSGLTIFELTSGLAGNFAGVLLADLGARVIKVEQSGEGDPIRRSGPGSGGDSLYFQTEARGKQSVALDLHNPRGRELAFQLMVSADAVIEDLGAGQLEELGLDPARLMAANPRLSLLRLSGFGQTGPLSQFAADDRIAQAFCGAMYVTGYPHASPEPISVPLGDYWSGLVGAIGLQMALYASAEGLPGQVVDLALYEAMLRFQEELVIQYDLYGTVRERMGNEYAEIVPSNHFFTSDGRWVAISAANDRSFQRICEGVGQPEAAFDPRIANPTARCQNREIVNALIADWVKEHTAEEVVDHLERASAPVAILYSMKELFADPHVQHRGNLLPVPSSDGGTVRMQGIIPRISGAPDQVQGPAPRLGEQTNLVLSTLLGLSDLELAELSREGVIAHG